MEKPNNPFIKGNVVDTEMALRQSEERLRLFTASSSNMIYRMSPDWTQLENLAGNDILADTPEPLKNWQEKYIPREDQPLIHATIAEAIAGKTVFELEHRVKLADGSIGWVHSRAITILNHNGEITEWFGTASDITQRHRAKDESKQSGEKYQTITEIIEEGFCICEVIYDDQGKPVDSY